ncbi:uncharacterized protein [Pocillopora verrucosa]|uniref:uncharacterized protein n=1 Tax=Pocillopora verrucosa TaxID=203993 RepID=UPI003342518E
MTPYTFTRLLCLLLFVLWSFLVEGSHFRHAFMSFAPTDADNNTIRFTFRLAFRRSFSSYQCDENTTKVGGIIGSGNYWRAKCSDPLNAVCWTTNIADTGFRCTDFSRDEDWSMGENNFTYTFPSGILEWNVRYYSCCWISNLVRYANSAWLIATNISLSRRSDNGKINSAPVSRSPAIVRFQQGCQKSLKIPVEDPDGDFVKCRSATDAESSIPRDSFPHGELDEKNCVLTYKGGYGASGTYAVTLTLEDFPAGTTNFNNIRPFSAVPLQFLAIISVGSGSCQDIPVFTASTPKNGECSEIQIGSVYKAVIEVQHPNIAKHIVEITTSSPFGMQSTSLNFHGGIFYKNVTWYPNKNQVGQQLFCFQALDSDGVQSEWRCVTILVGLSNTPHVILGTRRPISPISEFGAGLIWWSIHFDRVIKKPRSSAFIRLVLQSNGVTVFKVNALSGYVIIDNNRTVLHFATPKAALSMNGSYAILIDPGAVVGQGCSYDGPPTPGITSLIDWAFPVDGVCPLGYALVSPSFQKCEDIDECGGHHRSKRSYWWYNVFSQNSGNNSTSTATRISPSPDISQGITPTSAAPWASASAAPSFPSECYNYSHLTEAERSMGYDYRLNGYLKCDRFLPFGWYRFDGAAGTEMPTSCVGQYRCGTHAPGWLNGSHPRVTDGIVTAKVCFHWGSDCCLWSANIRVRNCSGFYVYELVPPRGCHLRYCGNGGALNTTSIAPTPSHSIAAVTPATPVHGIQPAPASAMTTNFYAVSSVNVQPDPSQFQLHLPAQCEQNCHNTLGSYTCSCVSGYQLAADGKSCLDVDECSISNGGCSHHCYNIPGSFYCGCPEGTSMGANNLTCVEPGVSVNCSDIITVALEKKTFPFFDVARLHLRYSSCKATQNDTHLLISTPLNGCGTLLNDTEDDLIFWNEIRTEVVLIDNVITRSHDVKIPFYCSYSRRKWVNLGFKPQHLHFGTEAGYGNFTFKIDFYKSSSFATPYTEQDYPLSVAVNQYLYVKYSVESSADLVIMAVTCRATKTGSLYSWPQYSIILNGCPQDTSMEYNFDPQRNYQQFKIRAFRFFKDYDQVYIHCEVLACHKYSPNSRCTRSCVGSKNRKRRDVTRDETEHEESTTKVTLTRGPLIFQQDEEPGDSGQNKQTALIGGVAGAGGFALVAVAALAVLFVKYRMARRFMNRNKVGDQYATQDEQLSRRNAYVQPEDMVEQEDSF